MDDPKGPTQEKRPPDSVKVLVVEDDPDLRWAVCESLGIHGFQVAEASNGSEAVKMATEEAYDVVVSDIRLPGLSGIEVTRRVLTKRIGVKVILITAFPDLQTVQEGYGAGAIHVLSKPVGMRKLALLVEEAALG